MLPNKLIDKKNLNLIGIKKVKFSHELRRVKKTEDLYKVKECGVCSSDLKFIFTGSRIKKFPVILGHELLAVKMAYNSNKKKYVETKKNTVFGAEIPCKKCKSCLKKNPSNMCDNPLSVGSNLNGGFSNYFIVNKKILKNIPQINFKKRNISNICLSESVACVVNALKLIDAKKNNSILIIGSGYMGLLFVNIAKIYGLKKITVLDLDKNRLSIAKKVGADNIILVKNKLDNKIRKKLDKITDRQGFDRVISSNSNIESHEFSIYQSAKLGKVNLYGGLPKQDLNKLKIDANFIHYNQITITGSFSSNQDDLNEAFSLISKKKIKFNLMNIKNLSFPNFSEEINNLKNKKYLKCIFKP
ncbi:MAG: hypothetical protein CMI79_03155 [Candidatus Pelagibacter sp.]|nr:hypothetical protein [Candidatus Pelagibacter sp.]|tara:strand:- start:4913 stop:5986 length:1074 start_codon:yes stop_codon:yes gene_type:complete